MRVRDRVGAVVIGMIGGFWLGLLVRVFFGPMPVSFTALAFWAVGGVIVGAILGVIFPRVVSVILYPFAFLGIGSN